jgi:cobalt-zinc-cadmium efflux system membrane fusion protein
MIALLAALPAFAHGGEDHGAPPPPVASAGDAMSVATWSTEYEAVLRFPYAPPGEQTQATLVVADWSTSAPLGTGEGSLSLSGAAEVQVDLHPGQTPGIWPFPVTFPADGTYRGGLSIIADRADLLGIPEFIRAEPVSPETGVARRTLLLGVAGSAVGGLVAGLLLARVLPRWRRVAPSLLLVGLALGLHRAWAHGGEDHGPPAAPEARTSAGGLPLPLENQFLLGVRTAIARRGPFEERVRTFGVAVTRPGGGAEIHAPVTGVLSLPEAGVVPGQLVRAGDPLATIVESLGGAERSDVVAGRSQALLGLAEARKQLAIAERDAERARSLGAVLSERERMERQQALSVAREAVVQAESAASSLGSRSSTTTLRAPLSGRISAMLARPGDVVTPGDVLFRIVADGDLWVEVRAPEALGGRLQMGAPATVVADARPDTPLAATVLDPGSEADPDTGTLAVTLALDEATDWLKPGMAVTASIVSGTVRETLSIPDSAVVDSAGESLVFIKTGPEAFEVRPVRTGALSADRREVLAGLDGGERVVTEGTYVLRSLAGR